MRAPSRSSAAQVAFGAPFAAKAFSARKVASTSPTNGLVASFPRRDRQQLLAIADQVELGRDVVLQESREVAHHVYFPTGAVVAASSRLGSDRQVALALVGREGMLGIHAVLCDDVSVFRATVVLPGTALRIDAARFTAALDASSTMRQRLMLYVLRLSHQIAATAVCTRFHTVAARLARWLLMLQDRSRTDVFTVTQRHLADALGVRRASATHAAIDLKRRRLIDYHRSQITVLDHLGLESFACQCVAADRAIRIARPLAARASVGRRAMGAICPFPLVAKADRVRSDRIGA